MTAVTYIMAHTRDETQNLKGETQLDEAQTETRAETRLHVVKHAGF